MKIVNYSSQLGSERLRAAACAGLPLVSGSARFQQVSHSYFMSASLRSVVLQQKEEIIHAPCPDPTHMAPGSLLHPGQTPAPLHKKTLPRAASCLLLKLRTILSGLPSAWQADVPAGGLGRGSSVEADAGSPARGKLTSVEVLSLESSSGPELQPLACQSKPTSRLVKNLGLSPGSHARLDGVEGGHPHSTQGLGDTPQRPVLQKPLPGCVVWAPARTWPELGPCPPPRPPPCEVVWGLGVTLWVPT